MANAFAETRNLFIDHTGYTRPLSYEEWVSVPKDNKAAVLFVQFYEQITLAWYKTKSFFVLEEDGVATMLQYLVKNVPLIEADEKKFRPNYIYKVAFNCLYCISHDIKRDIERYETEISNVVPSSDGELDLFDLAPSADADFDMQLVNREFWAIIEDMGEATQKVVEHLLNGTPLKKNVLSTATKNNAAIYRDREKLAEVLANVQGKNEKETRAKRKSKLEQLEAASIRESNYHLDMLKEIEVTADMAEQIIEQLRIKLARFKEYYNM